MKRKLSWIIGLTVGIASCFYSNLEANESIIPQEILKIMQQPKYKHANWGIFVKDGETQQVLYDLNSIQLFLPGSTTKLFSVAALLHAYGDRYRFKTPVFAFGKIKDGTLEGDLVLVAQGDLTLGGRQGDSDTIAYTKFDHIYANTLPRAILTKQDPLHGLHDLAKQVREKGIQQINGNVLIDDRLFQTVEKRDMLISPIMVNENLIDIVINPGEMKQKAQLTWRPNIPGYTVKNEVITVAKEEPLNIEIISDEIGKNIVVKGTIPINQKDVVRTFAVKNPKEFAQAAFIHALRQQGITVQLHPNKTPSLPSSDSFQSVQPVAVWTSPPLSEYAKLILKVSHNLGADLIPLLLAVQKGKATFDEGMLLLGKIIMDVFKISPHEFVFVDAAGGDNNRLTPRAEVQLLDYVRKLPPEQFQHFYEALPILGIDGSLEDVGKNTDAVGKIHAKTGTGVSYNLATQKFFLNTQALAGYIEGKNGHLIEFMIAVNNAQMPQIEDVFAIFEDQGQMTAIIYDLAQTK